MIMPMTDKPVKLNKNSQSISKLLISPRNPIKDLTAIIRSEVPIAFFIGIFANNTNAGMIKKPPPAPTNPVSKPTRIPSIAITGKL